MRTIRRRLMRSYANLDIPIEWKDEAVATWAKGKGLTTRRDVAGYAKDIAGESKDGFPKDTVRSWPEYRWFVKASQSWSFLCGAKNLVEIRYPEHLTLTDGNARTLQDTALTGFEFPLAATAVETCMFMNCANLRSVRLSPGMAKFNQYAFEGCGKLEMAEWPETLTYIGTWCFSSPLIKKLKVLAKTPPTLYGTDTFVHVSWPQVYVPDGSVEAYKVAGNWSAQADKIHPLSEWKE